MKLADYRKKNELSQQALADLVGCTQGRIAQLEAGAQPSFALAQKIARSTGGKVGLKDWDATTAEAA